LLAAAIADIGHIGMVFGDERGALLDFVSCGHTDLSEQLFALELGAARGFPFLDCAIPFRPGDSGTSAIARDPDARVIGDLGVDALKC
jgi:hypothetical protein